MGAARCGRLRSIDLLTAYDPELTPETLTTLAADYRRISSIVVHSSPEDRALPPSRTGVTVLYRREVVDSPRCCGQIHPDYFVTNLETFAEAQKHNTCLNRKISLDARGEIKNCPSMARSYGNARQVPLHSSPFRSR